MNHLLELLERHSTPAKNLVEPAPDDTQLRKIFELAMYAPDHGRIYPYRFIVIRGDAREALSQVFGEAVRNRDPAVSAAYLKKQMDKPLRSPLIVVVVACFSNNPKVPEIEQLLSAGAAAHGVLLASNALGFGSIWLTGDNAYDPAVESALALEENEKIVGFIYLGSENLAIPGSPKPDPDEKISYWVKPV